MFIGPASGLETVTPIVKMVPNRFFHHFLMDSFRGAYGHRHEVMPWESCDECIDSNMAAIVGEFRIMAVIVKQLASQCGQVLEAVVKIIRTTRSIIQP